MKAQEYLDKHYPTEREKITKLDLSYYAERFSPDRLRGELDLSDFTNLEELICKHGCLTSLDISKCPKLVRLEIVDNGLDSLDLTNNNMLEKIDVSSNIIKNDLNIF